MHGASVRALSKATLNFASVSPPYALENSGPLMTSTTEGVEAAIAREMCDSCTWWPAQQDPARGLEA